MRNPNDEIGNVENLTVPEMREWIRIYIGIDPSRLTASEVQMIYNINRIKREGFMNA